jgi:hypothetical protein
MSMTFDRMTIGSIAQSRFAQDVQGRFLTYHDPAAPQDTYRLTYSECRSQVTALKEILDGIGVRPGDRVVLHMENSAQFVIALLAIVDMDAVVVPTIVQYAADELAYVAEHSECSAFITNDRHREMVKRVAASSQNPPWAPAAGHNYRFQSKRIQHGCNYGLEPFGISMIARIPLREAKRAYEGYHEEFPGIKGNFHAQIRARVEQSLPLVSPIGREITLLGRPWDGHTFKQGLAAIPQSLCVDVLNVGMYRVWKQHDPERVQLIAQVHDAIFGQVRADRVEELAPEILKLMEVPVPINGRMMTIPVEISFGKNWGKGSEDNPGGQKVFHV